MEQRDNHPRSGSIGQGVWFGIRNPCKEEILQEEPTYVIHDLLLHEVQSQILNLSLIEWVTVK